MTKSGVKWVTFASRAYYVIGTAYYIYHWFLILGTSGLVLSLIFALRHTQSVIVSVLITLSIIAIIAGISFWRRLFRIQRASLNPGLRILEMTVDYRYGSPTECDYIRSLKVKALHSVSCYRAKFKWSADGELGAEVLNGAKDIQLFDHSTSVLNACQIDFLRPLGKNESLEFAYRITLRNASPGVKPFLGHTVDSPTHKILLKARLAQGCRSTQFLMQMFLNSRSEMPLKEDLVQISAYDREIQWPISNAQAGYYYRISW